MLTRYPRRLATKLPEKTANRFRSKAASRFFVPCGYLSDEEDSSVKATNDSEAAQEARNHSSSLSLDLGMPGSTSNTLGSNGQND